MNKRFYATATMALILATVFGGRLSHTKDDPFSARAAEPVKAQPRRALPTPRIDAYPLRVRRSHAAAARDG